MVRQKMVEEVAKKNCTNRWPKHQFLVRKRPHEPTPFRLEAWLRYRQVVVAIVEPTFEMVTGINACRPAGGRRESPPLVGVQ